MAGATRNSREEPATQGRPGGLWATLEQATEREREAGSDLWESLRDRLDFSKAKTRRLAGTEVAHHRTARGEEYYVLRNPEANTYLKLTPQDYFLWELLDGEHSVRDLAVAYVVRYGTLPFQRLPHAPCRLPLAEQGHGDGR